MSILHNSNIKLQIQIYSEIFETKEEMYLIGYLTGQLEEKKTLEKIIADIKLLEENTRLFLQSVKEFESYYKAHLNHLKNIEALLEESIRKRGAEPPKWLRQIIVSDKK